MGKKGLLLFSLLSLLLVLAILCARLFAPERRAARFVARYSEAFSEQVSGGQVIPSTWEGVPISVWSGEHPQYEVVLGHGFGDAQYWGVYYSPDDVPLPFQNADVALSACGEDGWIWQADGDNHGRTKKIADRWYFFEASF